MEADLAVDDPPGLLLDRVVVLRQPAAVLHPAVDRQQLVPRLLELVPDPVDRVDRLLAHRLNLLRSEVTTG